MTFERFEILVDEAIEAIPEEFTQLLNNVTIVVENFPKPHQLARLRMRKGLLLGLYEGTPQTRRGRYGIGGQIPDKITIFRLPIMYIARSEEHLKKIVQSTVEHEIAHHFGMDEHTVRKAQTRTQ